MTIGLSPGITSTEELLERFTNRQSDVEAFRKALAWNPDIPASPLVFLGEGGQGKTTLRSYLAKHVCEVVGADYGIVDFDTSYQPEPFQVLFDLRNQLVTAGIKFDCFDCVWSRFTQVTVHPDVITKHAPGWLNVPVKIAQAVSGLDLLAAADIVTEYFPRAKDWLLERFGSGWQARLKNMQRDDVTNVMPDAFAEDLERTMYERTSGGSGIGNRIVLFFDGIDRATDDYIVTRLCGLLRSPFIVIFGRRLSDRLESALRSKLLVRHLPNFSRDDAVDYLRRRGVTDPDLALHLFKVTSGFPYSLAIRATECLLFKQQHGHLPDRTHFNDEAPDEVEGRMLRDLGDYAREAIRLASVPRWFNEEVLYKLTTDGLRAHTYFNTIRRSELCRPLSSPAGAYTVIQNARNFLRDEVQGLEEWPHWNEVLRDYHAGKASFADAASFIHKVEWIYHELFMDEERGVILFDDVFRKCLNSGYFVRCHSLAEAAQEWAKEHPPQGALAAQLLVCEAELYEAEELWDAAYHMALSAIETAGISAATSCRAWKTLCYVGLRREAIEDTANRVKDITNQLEGGLERARVAGDIVLQIAILGLLSEAYAYNDNWEKASARLEEAVKIYREAGQTGELIDLLIAASRNYLSAGNGPRAWDHISRASSIAARSKSVTFQAKVFLAKARFAETWQDWYGALWACQQTLELLLESDRTLLKAEVLMCYAAVIEAARKDSVQRQQKCSKRRRLRQNLQVVASPADCYRDAIATYSSHGRRDLEGRAMVEFARYYWSSGLRDYAVEEVRQAIELFQTLGMRADLGKANKLAAEWAN
jgi:hypothetical protein